MFSKDMKIAYLLDFYGEILEGHHAELCRAYYEDDLSLAEIAEGEGISRQGVRHIIKKCEEQLIFLEERLGLAARFSRIDSAVLALRHISAELISSGDEHLCSLGEQIKLQSDKIAQEN